MMEIYQVTPLRRFQTDNFNEYPTESILLIHCKFLYENYIHKYIMGSVDNFDILYKL